MSDHGKFCEDFMSIGAAAWSEENIREGNLLALGCSTLHGYLYTSIQDHGQ